MPLANSHACTHSLPKLASTDTKDCFDIWLNFDRPNSRRRVFVSHDMGSSLMEYLSRNGIRLEGAFVDPLDGLFKAAKYAGNLDSATPNRGLKEEGIE